ncbi:hypothetical protein Drorol1_Dr00011955 [Drosera rotundifolia]
MTLLRRSSSSGSGLVPVVVWQDMCGLNGLNLSGESVNFGGEQPWERRARSVFLTGRETKGSLVKVRSWVSGEGSKGKEGWRRPATVRRLTGSLWRG